MAKNNNYIDTDALLREIEKLRTEDGGFYQQAPPSTPIRNNNPIAPSSNPVKMPSYGLDNTGHGKPVDLPSYLVDNNAIDLPCHVIKGDGNSKPVDLPKYGPDVHSSHTSEGR